ncbi:MAG TPA: SDR family NAD(P)-dependent oxidoreductase [Jatrophihabitantaceae bacterium]|nr:SDR family NAD(P)-dependent oxidoreductase [Jatrophihabitantaceae bacterium]
MNAVLITGASRGIGEATARALVERGYDVYAGVRRVTDAPAGTRPVQLDVTDEASIASAVEDIAALLGGSGLQALINNAGIIVQGPLELTPADELRQQFEVNVIGPAAVMRACVPLLRQGNGRIVNISAPTARVAMPFLGPLSASKAALESLSHAARVELAPWRIPVVLVVPGAMDTQIFTRAGERAEATFDAAPSGQRALYEPALAALEATLAKAKPNDVGVAVKAIVRAVESRKPKTRYVAGRDARSAAMLTHVPTRTRDRLLISYLGLRKVPRSAADATS